MTEPASASRLQLIENLDLKAAASLRSDLLSLRHTPLDIDASDVQRLGGLCLQVLMSAQASQNLTLDHSVRRFGRRAEDRIAAATRPGDVDLF